jgi:hypothetical protein
MAKEIQRGEASMGKGVCGFWFEPPQIEHPNENEVSFWTFSA